jgi:MFS family permease
MEQLSKAQKIIALFGITFIVFIAFLEYTIVNTALPTIQNFFNVSLLNLQWIFNIYSMGVAIFMIIFGRLGDLYGHRRIFYLGIFLLAAGSLGAGLSKYFWCLIAFRGLQSLGVAAIVTLGPGLINHIFQGKVHHPMSFYGTVTGIGVTLGPIIGGLIVMHWDWQWIFYINIPLLMLGSALCLPFIPKITSSHKTRIDYYGGLLIALSLAALMNGIIHGEQAGWSDHWTLLFFAIFAASFPLLIFTENRHVAPLLNFHFFKIPVFLLGVLAAMMSSIIFSTALFFCPLLLQEVLLLSPKAAGSFLLAIPVAIIFLGPFIGKIVHKIGIEYTLLTAMISGLIAAILYTFFASHTSMMSIAIAAFVFTGIAWGIVTVGASISAMTAVPPSDAGAAIGTTYSSWNIAAALIIAITSVIFHQTSNANPSLSQTAAFLHGFQSVFIWTSVTIALLIIVTITLIIFNKKRKLSFES